MFAGVPLAPILKAVSRSFYLSIRFLPRATRRPIAVAYLLARAADSVADTPRLPVARRAETLERLRALYQDPAPAAPGFPPADVVSGQETEGERALLTRLAECLDAYRALDPADHALVRDVVRTLTSGMVEDLARFPEAGSDPTALTARTDLDRYCFSVAGCVGEFWTRLHVRHLPSLASLPLDEQIADGIRLGKGLQMTNVLRDIPRDLRRGRCYLPAEDLVRAGLAPRDLLDPAAWPRLHPLVEELLEVGFGHLEAGLRYVRRLPAGERRLRLTCWWPLALAVDTLGRLRRAGNLLDPSLTVKVPRRSVYRLLLASILRGASDRHVSGRFLALARVGGFLDRSGPRIV